MAPADWWGPWRDRNNLKNRFERLLLPGWKVMRGAFTAGGCVAGLLLSVLPWPHPIVVSSGLRDQH